MDPNSPAHGAQPDERLSSLIGEYFDRRQAGEELTTERFVAEHPELADELRPYLAGLTLIEKARTQASATAADVQTSAVKTELPSIPGYELIREIGRGGMGVAYKALQLSTKRVVALKVMLAGPFASASARTRFDREVELAARLKHPSIVRVLESGDVAGQRYYAMDYVTGVRLDRYLSTSRPDVRTILNLFAQICRAVQHAHGHGVIHRDLKPGNVLIDEEAMPYILDFGLAKTTDQADSAEALTTCVSLPGQVLGTLFYLSPEQAAGTPDEIDARTDVYALGVMLFEALTGALPFDTTGRPSQVIERILEATPTTPTSLSDQVDGELETIILKALEKEKTRRYQSPEAMAEDIRRYLAGEPILARRPSSLYVLRKKLRKHRVAAGLGSAAVALALLALLLGLWQRQHELARARRAALTCQENLEDINTAAAIGPAKALHERHPELAEASLVWAQAQYRNDLLEPAIRFLETRLQRDPSQWAYRALLAEMYRQAGDLERADTLHAQAEHEAPDTPEAWYLRSLATLDLHAALRCAQESVNRGPSHTLAWRRLASLRLKTDDLDGARRAADKLIDLGQDAGGYWTIFKGQTLARQGQFQQAIELYTRAMTIRPEYAIPYTYRAHAYRRLKEYRKAVADYTKALELDGEVTANVWYCYQRATALWILGRTDEALEDYRRFRILHGRPWYSDARCFLILREQGRRREAEEVLAAALHDVQDRDPWLSEVFRCLSGQLRPDQLVDAAATRGNPEHICEAYYYAGESYLLSSQLDEARRCFEQCVQTGVEFDLDTFPLTPMNEFELAQWRLESLPVPAPTTHPEDD